MDRVSGKKERAEKRPLPESLNESENTSKTVLEEIFKTAVVKDKAGMKKAKDKKLVALSTCQYPDTVYRIVVICYLD